MASHPALLGFGFLSVFWGNYGHSFFLAWFGAPIQESLNLSAAEYGSAYTLANIGSAISIVYVGSLIDKVSLNKYVLALTFGLALAAFWMSQVSSFITLCVGFYLIRLFGQASLPHAGIVTMSRNFDLNRGKAISLAGTGVPVGEIVLPLAAAFLISSIGWRQTFSAISIASIVFFLPLAFYLLYKSGAASEKESGTKAGVSAPSVSAKGMLKDYRYWMTVPAMSLPAFIVTGIFIQQAFILREMQWSTVWFASCFVMYGASHWVTSIITGILIDRFKAIALLPFYLIPLILAQVFLAVGSGAWVAAVMMVLLGVTMGANQPISSAFWTEVYGVKSLGAIRSINIAVRVFIGSLSPVIFGLAIDAELSLLLIFSVSAVYCVLANTMLAFAYREPSRIA